MSDLQSQRIDLASVWRPDSARRSGLARVLGLIRLSRKHLQHRFLESLLIVLGIAVGVGVLTGMETFIRFAYHLEARTLMSAPELRSISVQPRGLDLAEFYNVDGGVAAIRVMGDLSDPITLTAEDLVAARREVPGVGAASASSGVFVTPITAIDGQPATLPSPQALESGPLQMLALRVEGYTPDDLVFRNRKLVAGRNITWEEYTEGAPVLLVEEEDVELAFPGSTADEVIGRTLAVGRVGSAGTVQGVDWRIIGVLAKAEESDVLVLSSTGVFNPGVVRGYGPHTVGAGGLASVTFNAIRFLPADGVAIEALVADLELFFAQRHGEGRVSVTNQAAQLRQLTESTRGTFFALIGLASLALLIAALNILNLFTAKVIRRRRVTAMSVALGAERRSLFARMMTEALLLGVSGSLFGLVIAYGITALLKAVLMAQVSAMPLGENPFEGFGLGLYDVAVGVAAGVGTSCLFGLYPAYLSASIDPADGLRTE